MARDRRCARADREGLGARTLGGLLNAANGQAVKIHLSGNATYRELADRSPLEECAQSRSGCTVLSDDLYFECLVAILCVT